MNIFHKVVANFLKHLTMNKKVLIILIGIIFNYSSIQAQENSDIKSSVPDMSIPAAPAYQMLDANASLVGRASVTRDFKVDWSLKSYRLAPNLALELQPVWLAAYSGKNNLTNYRKSSRFLKSLSTLSVSAGTLDGNDTTRNFAYAFKINLYRSRDPLLDDEIYGDYLNNYTNSYNELVLQLENLKKEHTTTTDPNQKDSLTSKIILKESELYLFRKNYREKLKQQQEEYKNKYWNTSYIDIAFGKSYSFNPKFSERIDSLKFVSTGNAVWINASIGVGRKWLFSGLVRSLQKTGTVRNTIIDSTTLVPITTNLNKNLFDFGSGFNIRYGSIRYSFFIEGFYTITNKVGPIFIEQIDSGNDQTFTEEKFTVAYGGDLKLGNNVLLNYGIRTGINKNLKITGIVPIASVTCLMR
jgi:hypothetical protein